MPNRQSGKVVVVIFACLFLIPGLILIYLSFVPGFKYVTSQNWRQVDADIIAVEQIESRNDGSTTFGVRGSYRYEYDGITFQSSRLGFYSGKDNLGSYQEQLFRRLKTAQSKGETVTAWVDPDSPRSAYLDRTLRGGMFAFMLIFGLVFATVGGGIMLLSRHANKRALETERLAETYPKEPWKWRPEWRSNVVNPNAGLRFKGLIFFAVLWNLISIPSAAIVFFGEKSHPLGMKLIILLFPLIGLFLTYIAIKAYRIWKKYGAATLRMKSIPFRIGGDSSGKITIPRVGFGEEFVLTLSCLQKTRKRSGKRTRTDTKILWQGDRRVQSAPGSDNVANLEYEFSIPKGLPESRERENNRSVEWQMSCQWGSDTGLKLEFEVPAFVTDDLDFTAEPTKASHATWNEDTLNLKADSYVKTTGDWRHLGVIQSRQNGGIHYYFPPSRNFKFLIPIPLFGVVFTVVTIGLFLSEASFLLVLIFGAVGLLFIIYGIYSLLFRSEIRIVDGNLHVRKGMLGMKHVLTCASSDIHQFDISSNVRSGQTRLYRLSVKMINGEKELLGKNLLVKSDVESLINQIQSDLGIPLEREKIS